MDTLTFYGLHVVSINTNAHAPPKPDNDNWRLMDEWETPAEFMQWVRQEQERLTRELAANERLLTCPKHRLTREIRQAMEKCCLWHYYGVR